MYKINGNSKKERKNGRKKERKKKERKKERTKEKKKEKRKRKERKKESELKGKKYGNLRREALAIANIYIVAFRVMTPCCLFVAQ